MKKVFFPFLILVMMLSLILTACDSGKKADSDQDSGGSSNVAITMSKELLLLKPGEFAELEVIFSSSYTGKKELTWKSSNINIAMVADGRVVGIEVGEAVVEARTPDGDTATCKVIVGDSQTDHTHIPGSAKKENEIPGGCTSPSVYERVVFCTVCEVEISRETVTVDLKGHSFSDWMNNTATCSNDGTETRSCTRCEFVETRYTFALGHDIVYHEAKEATCKEYGYNAYETCSKCDYTTFEAIFVEHTFSDWIGNSATCISIGEESRVCEVCDLKENRRTSALGHDIITHDAKEATCKEDGHNAYETCTRCTYITYRVILGDHKFSDWADNSATCLSGGEEKRICCYCDKTEIRATDPLGHDIINYDAKEATCKEYGYDAYETCSRCEYTTYVQIPIYGDHIFSDWGNDSATCILGGERSRICTACDKTETESTEPLGHIIINHSAKDSTCKEQGYYAYDTCTRCDYSTYKEKPITPHQLINRVVKVEEGKTICEDGGIETSFCLTCSTDFEVTLEPLGHNVSKWSVTQKPNQTTEGTASGYCSGCSTTVLISLPELNRIDYLCEDDVEGVSCINRVGDIKYTVYIDVTGTLGKEEGEGKIPFEFEIHVTSSAHVLNGKFMDSETYDYRTPGIMLLGGEPTCIKSGYGMYNCESCGAQVLVTTTKDHIFSNYKITKDPTCHEDGIATGTCSVCDTEVDEIIKTQGHNYVYTLTAEADGKFSLTTNCSNCSYSDKKDNVSVSVIDKLDATCRADGYTTYCHTVDDNTVVTVTVVIKKHLHSLGGNEMDPNKSYPTDTEGITEFAEHRATEESEGKGYYTCDECGEIIFVSTCV